MTANVTKSLDEERASERGLVGVDNLRREETCIENEKRQETRRQEIINPPPLLPTPSELWPDKGKNGAGIASGKRWLGFHPLLFSTEQKIILLTTLN